MTRLPSVALCLLATFALLAAPALVAQEPQMYHVNVTRTQLGGAPDYEANLTKMFAAAAKAGFSAPIMMSVSVTNPGEYTGVVPFSSWGDLDKLYATWNKTIGENPGVLGKMSDISTSEETSIWTSRPDLSYVPAKARLTQEEEMFSRMAWVYPHPGHALAIEDMIKEFVAINKKHGIDTPFQVFQQIVGSDGPVFGVATRGKDAADFHAHAAKNQAKTAADVQPLLAKMGPMMRKVEYTESTARPDISLQP